MLGPSPYGDDVTFELTRVLGDATLDSVKLALPAEEGNSF